MQPMYLDSRLTSKVQELIWDRTLESSAETKQADSKQALLDVLAYLRSVTPVCNRNDNIFYYEHLSQVHDALLLHDYSETCHHLNILFAFSPCDSIEILYNLISLLSDILEPRTPTLAPYWSSSDMEIFQQQASTWNVPWSLSDRGRSLLRGLHISLARRENLSEKLHGIIQLYATVLFDDEPSQEKAREMASVMLDYLRSLVPQKLYLTTPEDVDGARWHLKRVFKCISVYGDHIEACISIANVVECCLAIEPALQSSLIGFLSSYLEGQPTKRKKSNILKAVPDDMGPFCPETIKKNKEEERQKKLRGICKMRYEYGVAIRQIHNVLSKFYKKNKCYGKAVSKEDIATILKYLLKAFKRDLVAHEYNCVFHDPDMDSATNVSFPGAFKVAPSADGHKEFVALDDTDIVSTIATPNGIAASIIDIAHSGLWETRLQKYNVTYYKEIELACVSSGRHHIGTAKLFGEKTHVQCDTYSLKDSFKEFTTDGAAWFPRAEKEKPRTPDDDLNALPVNTNFRVAVIFTLAQVIDGIQSSNPDFSDMEHILSFFSIKTRGYDIDALQAEYEKADRTLAELQDELTEERRVAAAISRAEREKSDQKKEETKRKIRFPWHHNHR